MRLPDQTHYGASVGLDGESPKRLCRDGDYPLPGAGEAGILRRGGDGDEGGRTAHGAHGTRGWGPMKR